MGRKAGKLFEGTDIFYPRLLEAREAAIDVASRGGESLFLEKMDSCLAIIKATRCIFSNPTPPQYSRIRRVTRRPGCLQSHYWRFSNTRWSCGGTREAGVTYRWAGPGSTRP